MKMWSCSVCILIQFILVSQATLFCRDEGNNIVDWFVGYKLPRMKASGNALVRDGLAYSYITSADTGRGWTLSARSINDSLSILGQTLQPLYTNNSYPGVGVQEDVLWVLYNDQPPGGNVSFGVGHTKGVVMCCADGGVWLVHSVPHFPPAPGGAVGYGYPRSGLDYGQSFLCLSLGLKQLDTVGTQLMYNGPLVYGYSLAQGVQAPSLAAAAQGQQVHAPPWFHQAHVSTRRGSRFTSFAKASHFHKDLYLDWVAVVLQSDLAVESWLNGKDPLPSICTRPYSVQNVAWVDMDVAEVKFSTHLDHSKWAVSVNSTGKTWVCIGDINRMASQEQRGGGTVCMQDPVLWMAYSGLVSSVMPCP